MGPKKEIKCNAYSVYVRENHKLVGVTYSEGFAALRQQWKNLSKEEKEIYDCKAKQINGKKQKLTSAGTTYEELEE